MKIQVEFAMKKFIPFIFLLCISNVFGQVDTRPLITVSGKAEISVAPDHVDISLDITNLNEVLNIAKSANDATMSKVLAIVSKNGVGPRDAGTTYTSVKRKFVYIKRKGEVVEDEDGDEIGEKVFKGFEVSKTLRVTLRDLSKFQNLFDEIVGSGDVEINSISFETSKIVELKKQARMNAMKAAYEKAVEMTSVVGQRVGRTVLIKEGGDSSAMYLDGAGLNTQMTVGNFSKNESLGTFALGAIKIKSQVTVVFLIE